MKRTAGTYFGLMCACAAATGCFEPPVAADMEAVDASQLFPLPRPDAGSSTNRETASGAGCTQVATDKTADPTATTKPSGVGSSMLTGGSTDTMDHPTSVATASDSDAGIGETATADAAIQIPSGPPAPDMAGQLLFTEIMADPSGRTDAEGEWVELLNTTDQDFELKGCQLGEGTDSDPAFKDSFVVGSGAYVAIARNSVPGFVPAAVMTMSLRNTSDSVVLRCQGVTIDSLAYDSAAQYPIIAGASLSLSPEAIALGENDAPELFCAGSSDYGGDLGTPGAPNDACPSM